MSVAYGLDGDVAVVRMDDGKANAFSYAMIDALNEAFDRAEKEAKAIAWIGRAERFSGGFDLGVMRSGDIAAVGKLVMAGGRLGVRVFTSPVPIVIGCTGHALAMGAVALLAADYRVGALGPCKVGLNEVAIGLTLPTFATTLATARLATTHLQRAVALAEVYDGAGAVEAGFLDRAVEPDRVEATAIEVARGFTALHLGAYRATKARLRRDTLAALQASAAEDQSAIGSVAS